MSLAYIHPCIHSMRKVKCFKLTQKNAIISTTELTSGIIIVIIIFSQLGKLWDHKSHFQITFPSVFIIPCILVQCKFSACQKEGGKYDIYRRTLKPLYYSTNKHLLVLLYFFFLSFVLSFANKQ